MLASIIKLFSGKYLYETFEIMAFDYGDALCHTCVCNGKYGTDY